MKIAKYFGQTGCIYIYIYISVSSLVQPVLLHFSHTSSSRHTKPTNNVHFYIKYIKITKLAYYPNTYTTSDTMGGFKLWIQCTWHANIHWSYRIACGFFVLRKTCVDISQVNSESMIQPKLQENVVHKMYRWQIHVQAIQVYIILA